MTTSPQQCLQQAGMRVTFPRLLVLNVLLLQPPPRLTAQALYAELERRGSGIGPATVYRVLADLEQSGLVRRDRLGKAKSEYTLDPGLRLDH